MKTIAAIATAQGLAGIGVIRISGDKSKEIVDKVFKSVSGKKLSEMKGYTASYGKIMENDEIIDDAVVLSFNAPHSYTGEDVVEISCHGGMYIIKKVLRIILNAGASPAQPGEFTKRAFLNSKMTLTQAESIMDVIAAKGKAAARIATSLREGALYKKIKLVIDELTNCAAHLSAWADYPEDDIPQVENTALLNRLELVYKKLEETVKNYDTGAIIKEGINTVIAGKPNVGKSTIMNVLSGYEKSIVTEIPGTTRDVVEEVVSVGDIMLKLSDTAGIRDTKDIIEKIGVDKAKDRIKTASLILAVFDYSKELCDDDKILLEELKDMPVVAIINKTDLEKKIDTERIESKINNIVYISAKDGSGVSDLENKIKNVLKLNNIDPNEGVICNERQYNAATKAIGCIDQAICELKNGITLDAITVLIEEAIQELLELTGERVTDAVVDQVFSSFCVGK